MPSEKYLALQKIASECAKEIRNHSHVHCVSHIDADGITSAAIIATAFERAGIDYEMQFVKQLDEKIVKELSEQNHDLVIFTDLGSGQIEHINNYGLNAIISDHHRPQGQYLNHLNPHLVGANGSYELSGSGTTYILANELGDNRDLASLAIVGCIGDLQYRKYGKLVSLNEEILKANPEYVMAKMDLSLYGKQTRPIHKMLQFSTDPYLPGLTGNEDGCIEFLGSLHFPLAKDERWRRWIDLEMTDKRKVISAIIEYSIGHNVPKVNMDRIVAECYELVKEKEGTETRDAMEFSTLLNATGRYMQAEIGFAVCLGDRGEYYSRASTLLQEHRKNLVDGINYVKNTNGVIELSHIQYFDAKDKIPETIVGIVAGMIHSSYNRNLPIFAFSNKEDGHKVSARGTQILVNKGLNLSEALEVVCKELGGAGGGHDIAAGATIPYGTIDQFLEKMNIMISQQIGSG
ncbi:DHH family phosphoesterase [uncultured Methanomethylovorans sp.]|uniref:DHH family phosphoesterase n=1 Tax=uncultured Methanomethylovorans sp. TaxID=183759 RepID=UPI002AA6F0F1|nr:DHH family phosphoesterase [uncultured Methanomethylovorans sp.]